MTFFKDRWLPGGCLTWLGRLGLPGLWVIFLAIVSTTTKGHAQAGRIVVEPPYSLSNTAMPLWLAIAPASSTCFGVRTWGDMK
jgi:hypothetical protein